MIAMAEQARPTKEKEMAELPESRDSSEPDFLTVEEWASKHRVSRLSAYRAVKNGEVEGVVRIGRVIRIRNQAAA
jgi:hypothetical protein